MPDSNAERLNAAIDELVATREKFEQEIRRQGAKMGRRDALDYRPLVAMYRQSYKNALNTLRSLPPGTPGLHEAVGLFLVKDVNDLQLAGMLEQEKLLAGTIDEIMQKQVEKAYADYQLSGKSWRTLLNLLRLFEEALVMGVSTETRVMRMAKIELNGVAESIRR
jgi:hypothetical protein